MEIHADCRKAGERGFALIGVLVFLFIVSLTAISFYGLAQSESRHAEYSRDRAQSFWAAETGIDRGVVYLEGLIQPPTVVRSPFTGQSAGDGQYDVLITPDPANIGRVEKLFTIRSTGRCGRTSRIVEEVVRMEGFARYGYFTNSETSSSGGVIWFITGDDIGGLTHTNGTFHFSGRPRFRGEVTSASDRAVAYPSTNIYGQDDFPAGGNDPVFDMGFSLETESIPLPSDTGDLEDTALNGGLSLTSSSELVFGRVVDGTVSWRPLAGGTFVDVDLATLLEGVIHVKGVARVSGVLDGSITVGATGDIEIVDDLRYLAADPVTGQPAAGCDDILGLVSEKNIVVKDLPAARGDMIVDATLMALGTSFMAENHNTGTPRGVLHLWGGLIQDRRGAVGTFANNTVKTGYLKDYHYDLRVSAQPPPQFPLTGTYSRVSWRELSDPS